MSGLDKCGFGSVDAKKNIRRWEEEEREKEVILEPVRIGRSRSRRNAICNAILEKVKDRKDLIESNH